MAPDHIDAGGGGALISSCLNVNEAKNLIEKMVFNQGWSDERLQSHKQGMHTVKEVDMLVAKMDLRIKLPEDRARGEMNAQEFVKPWTLAWRAR